MRVRSTFVHCIACHTSITHMRSRPVVIGVVASHIYIYMYCCTVWFGLALSGAMFVWLLRYPTLRPVMFHDEQLMMGFHGKKSKGLWEERPYPGPIQPASIPTPPAMKFKLVDPQVYV